ncbi:hypothetical protein CEXT_722631 [Caerostris extrusa]|uniref:Uncharacterized protein n=1 Tax=Caerostris extrusa TaxID=172846 RepID=A0AAV4VFP8_CAEEX|nr:hypothetical protein CEXT_722631 [Caerostris extrusa]
MVNKVRVNTTFDITLTGNTVLPKGSLNGLVVDELCIDDPQTQVEEGAFEGCSSSNNFCTNQLYKGECR